MGNRTTKTTYRKLNHDYCHCNAETCKKKSNCFRYALYEEDKLLGAEYCTYFVINDKIDIDKCDSFIPMLNKNKKDERIKN